MNWDREPLSEFFRYKVLRTTDGLVWIASSILCVLGGVWFWVSTGNIRIGLGYFIWPIVSFLFYLMFEPLARTRLRILEVTAVGVFGVLPLLGYAFDAI